MLKIVETPFTPEEHYRSLDAGFTAILVASNAVVNNETNRLILAYERRLKIALGVPVEVAN